MGKVPTLFEQSDKNIRAEVSLLLGLDDSYMGSVGVLCYRPRHWQ